MGFTGNQRLSSTISFKINKEIKNQSNISKLMELNEITSKVLNLLLKN